MANIILENIAVNITSEQISKCSKIIDFQTGEDFYICESSNGDTDYEVRYDAEKGLTCTCEAGQHGFANCRNYCWHCRAAVACRREELKAERAARAIENNIPKWILR